jgi:hypothetical protein
MRVAVVARTVAAPVAAAPERAFYCYHSRAHAADQTQGAERGLLADQTRTTHCTAASELARLRWDRLSVEQRRAQMAPLLTARRTKTSAPREEAEGKSVGGGNYVGTAGLPAAAVREVDPEGSCKPPSKSSLTNAGVLVADTKVVRPAFDKAREVAQ